MLKTSYVVIRVTDEVKSKLQKLADNDKRKLSDFIRVTLENKLELSNQ